MFTLETLVSVILKKIYFKKVKKLKFILKSYVDLTSKQPSKFHVENSSIFRRF